jgi:hypothetical protein
VGAMSDLLTLVLRIRSAALVAEGGQVIGLAPSRRRCRAR